MARRTVLTAHRKQFHAEYSALKNAIYRCHNEDHIAYPNYGGRGITVCDDWRRADGFEKFFDHIGPRPDRLHSLDRIDNNKGYTPNNVRWSDRKTQQNNRRRNAPPTDYGWGLAHSSKSMTGGSYSPLLMHNGVLKTLSDWADELGMNRETIHQRLKRGLSVAEALNPELRKNYDYKIRTDLYL